MRLVLTAASLLFALALGTRSSAQTSYQPTDPNPKHDSEQWKIVESHLADPATSSAQMLETQADILRARKFPEDAMAYYQYAMARGGNAPRLLNKIGLVDLELHNTALARACFQRVTKMSRKESEAWNNLGAVNFMNGDPVGAISAYKKAIKFDKHQAVYHANIATAYFERKDYESARREIGVAMNLDPEIFDRRNSTGGVAAHVLSSEDRARFSYEMAKMYARAGLEEQMLHSLAMASEAGLDVQREMRKDAVLAKLADDPRVLVLVKNAQALRASRGSPIPAVPLPANKPIAD